MPFARGLPDLRGTLAGVSEAQPTPGLIAEATKRAGLIWITVPGQQRPRPVWHVWRDAAYVLTGPGEQDVPGLAAGGPVTVTVPSKDTGGRLVSWAAQVSRVEPGTVEWSAIIGALLAGRLNEPAGPGALSPAARWAQTGNVYRLTPGENTNMGQPSA
jgi:hypothetical protein